MSDIINTLPLDSSPLGRPGGALYIIKIGGNIIDDEAKLVSFLARFADIKNLSHAITHEINAGRVGNGTQIHGLIINGILGPFYDGGHNPRIGCSGFPCF